MFGFMRTRGCQRHYCAVCKTIGAEYGHAPRMLLNHDTVLVAEIMSALSPEPLRHPSLVRRNCLTLPRKDEAPLALRYAAATTMFLAGAKVRDHVADTGRAGWRLLNRALDSRYRQASSQLAAWGLPVAGIEHSLASQAEREAQPASLDQLSEPTAHATAQVCGNAAHLAGRPDAAEGMSRFGAAFGKLIYVLDAWHDYKRDTGSGQFNALHALYGSRENAKADLDAAALQVDSAIADLPLEPRPREALRARFQANLTFALDPVSKAAKRKASECLPDCFPDACDACCCDACCDSCDCDCCGSCCDCGSCDCGGCDC
jgi:hypothetical protein